MKCIMVRLDGYAFLDVSHDWYPLTTACFTHTKIIDIIGKMLCQKLNPNETATEAFNEYIFSEIGYEIDRRNEGKDDFDIDDFWTTDEIENILDYFISCYKLNLPYVPDVGFLKFMACVWHDEIGTGQACVCLVAEHRNDDDCIGEAEPDDTVREPSEGDGSNKRYLSAVFK